MTNRCFSAPKRACSTSGERTTNLRRKNIYKGLLNPKIKRRQGNFRINPCGCTIRNVDSCKEQIASAKSFALLNDAKKGRYLVAPLLEGATQDAFNSSWGASLLTMYKDFPTCSAIMDSANLDVLCEECPYASASVKEAAPIRIDPGDTVFIDPESLCYLTPGKHLNPRWMHYASIGFKDSPTYWAAANAQPYQGLSYNSPVPLIQPKKTSTTCFESPVDKQPCLPISKNAPESAPSTDTSIAYTLCAGKWAIN